MTLDLQDLIVVKKSVQLIREKNVQVMGNVLIIFANAKLDFMVEIAQYKCVPKIVMEMVGILCKKRYLC